MRTRLPTARRPCASRKRRDPELPARVLLKRAGPRIRHAPESDGRGRVAAVAPRMQKSGWTHASGEPLAAPDRDLIAAVPDYILGATPSAQTARPRGNRHAASR